MINPKTKVARELRNNLTEAEKKIWYYLRQLRHEGLKFRRQHPIGKYFIDFVCLEKKIIIEIDGGQHFESTIDNSRDAWLEKEGYKILRFWNNEVLENIEGVVEKILKNLK